MDKKWWTLVAVGAGTFMLLLDVTIVTVALPDIRQALNSSFSDPQWTVDAYTRHPLHSGGRPCHTHIR